MESIFHFKENFNYHELVEIIEVTLFGKIWHLRRTDSEGIRTLASEENGA